MTIIWLIDLESCGPAADALDDGIDCSRAVWIITIIIVIIIIMESWGGRGSSGPCIITVGATRRMTCNHVLRTGARARIPDFASGKRFL